ncbi:MAG: TolC family protein, partial [Bacteroidetes bacterium]|nr:TolC family protein [Bacteroidota bacterium]
MKTLITSIIFLSVSLFGFAQETLNLNTAIGRALESNLGIQVAQNATIVAQNNASPGNAGMLPTVTANGSVNGSVTNTYIEFVGGNPPIDQNGAQSATLSANVQAQYVLFNGFLATNTLSKLHDQTDLAKAQSQVQTESIVMQVVQAYYQALTVQNNIKAAENALAISKERYDRAALRVEFGSSNKIAMLNAEVDMQNDSITLVTLNQQLSNAKANLAYLMGQEGDVAFNLDEAVNLTNLVSKSEIESKAESTNASLLQARAQANVAANDIEISKAYLFPRISVNAGYSASSNQNDASFITTNRSSGLNGNLSLSYNIFDGGKNKIRQENAQIALDNAMLQQDDVQRQLSTQIDNAYTNYENGRAIYQLRKASVKVNEANFERSQEAFRAGQITGTEFREAQLNLLNAQVQENL